MLFDKDKVLRTEVGLTGRRRYRRGWFGRVILQVEVNIQLSWQHRETPDPATLKEWRDAMLTEVGLYHPHAHKGMRLQRHTGHFYVRLTPNGVEETVNERVNES